MYAEQSGCLLDVGGKNVLMSTCTGHENEPNAFYNTSLFYIVQILLIYLLKE